MKLNIDANEAIGVLIEMTAENIATNRLILDAIVALNHPDDEAAQFLARGFYRQKVEAARQVILDRIFEERGKVDLNDIGLGNDSGQD